MKRASCLCLLLLLAPHSGQALTLGFPANAEMTTQTRSALDSHLLATGPFADGTVPGVTAEGDVLQQSWRINAAGLTTLQLLRPLREQLQSEGFSIVFECETDACGGFDFRFGINVIGAPDMYVDLADFRYLTARRDSDGGAEHVGLVVSRSSNAGFVQVTFVGPPGSAPVTAEVSQTVVRAVTADLPDDFAAMIEAEGHVILSDLIFETGSAQLGPGPFASLDRLADYLTQNSDRQVALVGHTDSEGSLDGNIALSKRRAGSVLERLVSDYDIPRRQLAAEGMGFLAPIASNLTTEGRELNRRVEVIITSTE